MSLPEDPPECTSLIGRKSLHAIGPAAIVTTISYYERCEIIVLGDLRLTGPYTELDAELDAGFDNESVKDS